MNIISTLLKVSIKKVGKLNLLRHSPHNRSLSFVNYFTIVLSRHNTAERENLIFLCGKFWLKQIKLFQPLRSSLTNCECKHFPIQFCVAIAKYFFNWRYLLQSNLHIQIFKLFAESILTHSLSLKLKQQKNLCELWNANSSTIIKLNTEENSTSSSTNGTLLYLSRVCVWNIMGKLN